MLYRITLYYTILNYSQEDETGLRAGLPQKSNGRRLGRERTAMTTNSFRFSVWSMIIVSLISIIISISISIIVIITIIVVINVILLLLSGASAGRAVASSEKVGGPQGEPLV